MDAVKILQSASNVSWDYDEEADVLYLSVGKPRAAIGIDAGDGVVVRYDETANEVVGLTVIGLKSRLLKEVS